jgi:hypothetical protein
MDAHEDAQLRLAAFRHPAARVVGTLHGAQHQLQEASRAFLRLMSAAGDPGSEPLPPPGGRSRWPRGHQARQAVGWPLPVSTEESFQCWIDTAGRWWMIRVDEHGEAIDAHTVGSPLRAPVELGGYREGFEQILAACRVPR